MLRKTGAGALRYALALGAFVLVLLITHFVPRLIGFSFDLTSLIILVLIGSAWYLGRGPGLLVAVIFEATLVYFSTAPYTFKSGVITFNRLILFGSLAWFAASRRRAERNLREQREWLRVSLSSIGDAVIATDIHGKIQFVNPTAESLTGWAKADAEGKPLEEVFRIINEETRRTIESPFSVVIREGRVVGLANHTVLITKDNREIPIDDSGAPILNAKGKIIGVIIVFHDVSERRQIEQERESLLESEKAARLEAETANRLKDEFLAIVSHELRTPLNAILGWASILNQTQVDESAVRTGLGVIERNAKAQAEIVGDILDVSQIITGNLRIKCEAVEIAPVVHSVVESMRLAADAKNISLTATLNSGNLVVSGDPARLQQIFWNLISNAIKFTPVGGQIKVELERTGAQAEIKVIDSGIGIEREFLPHVFERFRQADSSTTRAFSGLGLGLAIVRHLVELQGGAVRAESEGKGTGAAFTVQLPLINAGALTAGGEGAQIQPVSDLSLQASPDLSSLRVLIVDDEPDTLEVLSRALKHYGAEVRTALSSSDALESVFEWRPDVLVSDIGMPGEDGYAFLAKFRALSVNLTDIPAVALTAYASEEDRKNALAAGFQKHISKPVEPDALAEAVNELAKRGLKNFS